MCGKITAEHVDRAMAKLIEPGEAKTIEFVEVAKAVAEAAGVEVQAAITEALLNDPFWSEEDIEAESDLLRWSFAVWDLAQELGNARSLITIGGFGEIACAEVVRRGYIYPNLDPEWRGEPTIEIHCWAPVGDAVAFEKAFLDMYLANWQDCGLPPVPEGLEDTYWSVGDGLMMRAVRSTVEAGNSWRELVETVEECLAGILEIWSAAALAEERSLDLATAERLIEAFRAEERPKQAWYDALDEREKDFVIWLLLRCY